MVFSYHLLYTKLTDLIPSASKKDIEAILDSIILKYIDRNTVSKYNFFKKAYFLEKGFVYLFSGYDNEPIQKCQDKLDYHKKNIQTFLQLIEELTTNVNKMPKIIDLAIMIRNGVLTLTRRDRSTQRPTRTYFFYYFFFFFFFR